MIGDFKATLFCQQTGVPRRELDSTDPLWVARINQYFAQQGTLPPAGDPSEYARAFEAVYPSVEERRTYIAQQVQRGSPSFAHRVLAALLATGRTPCVFTTNFDNLVETATTIAQDKLAVDQRRNLVVAAIDSAERAARSVRENDWPLLAKIHGDYQSVSLKNTEHELAAQDEKMRRVLVEAGRRFALVVVGYSGRDASVMAALHEALSAPNAYPGGIHWMTRSAQSLLPAVREFLESALAKGVEVNLLSAQTFDELAGDIAETLHFDDALERHIHQGEGRPMVRAVQMPDQETRNDPILRCSALRVMQVPVIARRISVQKAATLTEVRELLKTSKARASIAAAGKEFAAFGNDEQILSALAPLGAKLAGDIQLDPVQDSWALGLIYDAFVKALCRGRPLHPRLKSRGHSIVVAAGHPEESSEHRTRRLKELAVLREAYGELLVGQVQGLQLPFAEALEIRLEHLGGQWWCVFDPYTNVDLPREENQSQSSEPPLPFERRVNPAADWLRERWAQRYNRKWASIIAGWSQMLSGEVKGFWIEDVQGIDAVFQVGAVSAWSRPSHDHPYFRGVAR